MDHRLKLERAREHLDSLERAADELFQNPQFGEVRVEANPKTSKSRLRLLEIPTVPLRFSLLLGDAVHNMRSALDNLAYSLAAAELKRQRIKRRPSQTIQFPICDTIHGFRRALSRGYLSGVATKGVAAVRRLQPYRQPGRKKNHPLAVLRDLDNIDKHRHVLVAANRLQAVYVGFYGSPPPQVQRQLVRFRRGVVKSGAVVAEFPSFPPDANVRVEYRLGFNITFPDTGPAKANVVVDRLKDIRWHIETEVFRTLEPFLT